MSDSLFAWARSISTKERSRPGLAVGAMVFLGALLAFSLEPIVGRLVTPFFGGAVYVWTVSLMIFQALLLLGYLYAHLVAPRIGAWHFLVLLLPLLQWPLSFTSEIAPQGPIITLAGELLIHISLLFAVLSTTAVVAQIWWYGAPSSNTPRSTPFFLYGISNLGAMVALFSYPFLVEPLFGVTEQRWAWSIGYLIYLGVTAWAWYLLQPGLDVFKPSKDNVIGASNFLILRWLVLSAAPSALLLAVTNVIAMEVGSFPMVWVFPLALYLLSFIVAFREDQGRAIRVTNFWLIEITLLALLAVHFITIRAWITPLFLILFFALCTIANANLYRSRPHPRQLTAFYLAIAIGGLIGGMFVSLAAPLLFSGLEEYPLAVLAIFIASWRAKDLVWWQAASRVAGGVRLFFLMIGCTILGLFFWLPPPHHSFRNFYGVSRVVDQPADHGMLPYRALMHGATLHGLQYLSSGRRNESLGYYYVGGALQQSVSLRNYPGRVAMVGLGAGDAIPWFGPGEEVTVFEIDPDMESLARKWFSYLEDASAKVGVHIGDARLSLKEEAQTGASPYDVIFIDAFSGDGIPTHLLTLEALDVYLSRMAKDGLLVFHVSNRYYDFRSILKAAAQARGLAAVATLPENSANVLYINPMVVALAHRPERLAPLLSDKRWFKLDSKDGLPEFRVWTDDYVNILAPLSAR